MLNRIARYGLIGLLAASLCAVETKTWRQDSAAELEKGKSERIALRSDGVLTLAPALRQLLDASTPAIWALAKDSSGAVYTAASSAEGGKLKVYRIPMSGEPETIGEVDGLAAFSIAVDGKNRVYVGVSPEAKIYRIENGQASVFFQPDAEYIWALAFDAAGNLFAATGDKGVIYKVTPGGEGSVFFETEETHVRSLLVGREGNVYAGTSPGALVMRITPAGEGFVVYQAEKEEITALAQDNAGNLYAAAVGNKRPTIAPRPATLPPTAAPATTAAPASQGPATPAPRPAAPPSTPVAPRPVLTGGSQVLRIGSDGYPQTVWESSTEIVYALAIDNEGKLLAGTGNEAGLYRVDNHKVSTSLLNAQADQITALLPLKDGGVAFATANIGKVFQAGPEHAADGFFESEVFDSGLFARWGKVSVKGTGGGEALTVKVRSGNVNRPQKNWSEWAGPAGAGEDQAVEVPASRYVQWRAELKRGAGAAPSLEAVSIAYQEKNTPPRIVALEATPPNHAFPPRSLALSPTNKITLTPLSAKNPPQSATLAPLSGAALSMNYQKGFVGVRWLAEDENRDELVYKLEIRPAGGNNWVTLAEDLEEPQYSWDSTSWPDGSYEVRVTASDRKSNVPSGALETSEVSPAFTIDNTVPRITEMQAAWSGSTLSVRWNGTDERSHVRRAEYSLNGKDWLRVEPAQGLSDARSLGYLLSLNPAPEPGAVIAVRVRDEFDNESVASVIVPAK